MSDAMLHGILQMPPELWSNDAIDIAQRYGRYLDASKRIIELERERDEARMKWREAWDGWNEALEERNEARKGWSKALEERDEARKERDEVMRLTEHQWLLKVACRLVSAGCKSEGILDSLDEVIRERDEARRVNEWTEEFERLLGELNAAREEVSALKAKLDSVSQMNQHADKSGVGDSTYVLTQQPCQRASRVGMEPDWTAIGYREGMSAALHSGGIRGAKWHAERKGLQGEVADNYISGFNTALDEYKQEKA